MIIIVVLIMIYYTQQETNPIRRLVSWASIGLVVLHYITSNVWFCWSLGVCALILWIYNPNKEVS